MVLIILYKKFLFRCPFSRIHQIVTNTDFISFFEFFFISDWLMNFKIQNTFVDTSYSYLKNRFLLRDAFIQYICVVIAKMVK